MDDTRLDGNAFFKIDVECYKKLFQENEYRSKVLILESSSDGLENLFQDRQGSDLKVVLLVGHERSNMENFEINNSTFELRVVCVMKAINPECNSNKYNAIRYMRHGKGMNSWWKQERKDHVCVKHVCTSNIFQDIIWSPVEHYFLQYIFLYVKVDDELDDEWRVNFFECMGGKSHVYCSCCNFPLIPSNRIKSLKEKCNWKNANDGEHIQNCDKMESYVCTNASCTARICSRCYHTFPTDTVTVIAPNDLSRNLRDHQDSVENTVLDNEINSESEDNDSEVNESSEQDNDVANFISTYASYSEQDTTMDQTADNIDEGIAFYTTNSGECPVNVLQDSSRETVTGNVIFNQVGSCTNRFSRRIEGTSRQKHFVQKLCATTSGKNAPLLQPESSLFPRHFYISAKTDNCSILGARPLFCMNSKTFNYGFCLTLSQARLHMTNPFSTKSTDPNFMCMYFDQLANMSLNNNHSRDTFQRGFVVDKKSSCGLGVQDKATTGFSGCVDSRKMVSNLSASQRHIMYTWFLKFTASHSQYPGLHFLHQ